jgi:putative RecB family exonuclease
VMKLLLFSGSMGGGRHRALSMLMSPKDTAAVAAAAKVKRSQPLPMPPRLSPTAVSTFKECPQLFLFRNLWKLPEPPSSVLTKGILVHSALEKVFELPAAERSAKLHDVLRSEWRVQRMRPPRGSETPLVDLLFDTVDEERKWGQECLALLDNYLAFEDPAALPLGEPFANEAWLSAKLPTTAFASQNLPPLTMVGKVDRLDKLPGGSGGRSAEPGLVIVDYKTGKAPSLKYSEQMNQEIRSKNFFQLRCYALLLARGGLSIGGGKSQLARQLRLLYLGDGPDGGATPLDDELPTEPAAYEAVLSATQAEVVAAWAEIAALVARGEPEAFEHCSRSFCQCHELRPIVFGE